VETCVAVDNVCAWPNLTCLADGTIVATIFNQPCHGLWEGDVECRASGDEGRTWALWGVPAAHEPTTNRMNVAAGLAHDGRLIVLASGWSKRNPAGDPSPPHEGEVLPIRVCLSEDGGKSWASDGSVVVPDGIPGAWIPFGDIVTLPDGEHGVCLYSFDRATGQGGAHWFVSDAAARTWLHADTLRGENATETTPVVTADGTLLAALRTRGDQHLELFASDDHGRTWTERGAVSGAHQHPGHLLRLEDGRLLFACGVRTPQNSFVGIDVRLSADGGASWSDARRLAASGHAPDARWPASDGGYPSTVACAGGTLVTAYYTSHSPASERYHMAVVRWRLEEIFA